MQKEKLVKIAKRNLNKAKNSLKNNFDRPGVSEQERENLSTNVEYAQIVYDLIVKYV